MVRAAREPVDQIQEAAHRLGRRRQRLGAQDGGAGLGDLPQRRRHGRLISGATGGLGHALAAAFGRRGARLVLTARRAGPLRELAARSGARAVVADLADPADVERLAAESGDVDLLVANAALPGSGDLLDHSVEQLDRALRVNLRAPLVLSRLLLPAMLDAGRGHLAFIGSLSGKAAMSAAPLYGTTKFGLRGFALSLRQDLHGTGVGVSLIQPGPSTPAVDRVLSCVFGSGSGGRRLDGVFSRPTS
ncbi:SDR family NAD(P)-dependent oxidoreductase, partial [Streptomyces sp. NPDC058204]|uniref:SDR family NAD(P)-dependent oxidoreductase n=2 Tax=unclassified Streptomyces TaxID=2593676 RepID=UPI0036ECBE18